MERMPPLPSPSPAQLAAVYLASTACSLPAGPASSNLTTAAPPWSGPGSSRDKRCASRLWAPDRPDRRSPTIPRTHRSATCRLASACRTHRIHVAAHLVTSALSPGNHSARPERPWPPYSSAALSDDPQLHQETSPPADASRSFA